MAKRGGQLNKGPFSTEEIERVLTREGWGRVNSKRHLALKHPTKRGKVSMSPGWGHVRYDSEVFASIAAQAGLTKKRLLQLLNQ